MVRMNEGMECLERVDKLLELMDEMEGIVEWNYI